ncbi:MAG: ABC transporter ATP-binding protein [Oscillospiraceae bacterium]|nr:ABC transporter ATP-binding protein [Oscillospiraceae bacterium]
MIEIKNLSFSYGKEEILRDISFSVTPGHCVAILGNNGAGKSTLITCINRIRAPKSGQVLIDGQDIQKFRRNALARKVAYVAQKNELSNATIFDCVLLGRTPYIRWSISQNDLDICEEVIEQMGLSHMKLRLVDHLSGGELQKVMLARALVQQPELLLLDEPTSNLDPKNQYEMLALVQKIAREKNIAVLIVIHDLNLALRYCDQFYFIKDHAGYSYGGIETVTNELIYAVYGIEAKVTSVSGKPVIVFD